VTVLGVVGLLVGILLSGLVSYALLLWAIDWAVPEKPKPADQPALEWERPFTYASILDGLDVSAFRRDVEALSSLDSRVAGYDGCEAAAQYVQARFRQTGLASVGTSAFQVAVPLDQGGALEVGGASVPVYGLWPNSTRTTTLPPGGVSGPLLYARNAEFRHFDGHDVAGSIVLLDFNCGTGWINAFQLDAAAVVFIEPTTTLSGEAQSKVIDLPLDLPRFWLKRQDLRRVLTASGVDRLQQGQVVNANCRLIARMDWARQQTSNVFGLVPGADPELHREYVVITAYYDTMSVVPQVAPGADQTGGIGALLQLAEVFSKHPPARSVVFIAMSAHHMALKGMRQVVFQDTIDRVASMVNEHVKRLHELRTRRQGLHEERLKLLGQEPSPSQKADLRRVIAALRTVDRQINAELNQAARGKYEQEMSPRAVICLDLSSGNNQVGVFSTGDLLKQEDTGGLLKRKFAQLSGRFRRYAEAIGKEEPSLRGLFFDGIDTEKGRSVAELLAGAAALDSEVGILKGLYAVTLATAYDARALVNTPKDSFDTLQERIVSNVFPQAQLAACLAASVLNDTELPKLQKLDDYYRSLSGSVKEFDPASGFLPKDPVPGSVALLNLAPTSLKGVRAQVTEIADNNGEFKMRGLPFNKAITGGGSYPIRAYAVDPISGGVTYAPDLGSAGGTDSETVTIDAEDKSVRIIAFPCVPMDLFDLVDHRTFQPLTVMSVLDARTDAPPIKYGTALPPPPPTQATAQAMVSTASIPCAVVFAERDLKVKVLMGTDMFGWRYVLLGMNNDEKESGYGYVPPPEGRLANTTYLAAQDMYWLNFIRQRSLEDKGISSSLLASFRDSARAEIEAATRARQQKRYSDQVAHARRAMGYLARAYPDVMGTANDVVKGIVFYLFLLLPFSFFVERLLFGFPDVNRRIMGFFGIFVVTFALIAVVHPAFGLKKTLIVIPLGFVILTLSLLVIFIVGSRFEEEVRRLRKTTQVQHREDVGRVSAAAAAFSLGISNMRRRKMRTILTSITLILFMFTILSFTSVQSTLRFNSINLGEKTPYQGILLRSLAWSSLQSMAYPELRNDYRHEATAVLPRYWLGAKPVEKVRLRLTNPQAKQPPWNVPTAIGLSAAEQDTYLTSPTTGQRVRLGDMLEAGRWFEPEDRQVVMLPRTVAQYLGIDPADVNRPDADKPTVLISSIEFKVCGILDDKTFLLQDLDGEEFAPLDPEVTQQVAESTESFQSAVAAAGQGMEAKPQKGVHVEAKKTIVIPYQTLENMGGKLYSVAIVFGTGAAGGEGAGGGAAPFNVQTVKRLMNRAEVSVFVGVAAREGERPKRWLYSSVGLAAVSGAQNLLVPILIAVGIVLNTMLGSVYERTHEISIYSSVGLAPVHIGVLFIAESLVYAVVGGVAGYMVGQLVTKLVSITGLLAELSLNYSSMSAVLSSFIVMAVVVLSALYPAIKASRMAVPDVHRRWKPDWPKGDLWEFDLPFTVGRSEALGQLTFLKEFFDGHEEGSVGVFSCQGTELTPLAHPSGAAAQLTMNVWLAPFDFGVTQEVALQTVPATGEDIHNALHFRIQRRSGDMSNWRRANIRFVNEIRKQCLIWRIVTPEQKEHYQGRGRDLTGRAVGTPA